MKILGCPSPVVTIGLRHDSLQEAVKGLSVMNSSYTRVVYLLADDLDDKAYWNWYKKNTQDILNAMEKGLLHSVC